MTNPADIQNDIAAAQADLNLALQTGNGDLDSLIAVLEELQADLAEVV